MTVQLNVTKREERGKQLAALRAKEQIPAVVYGKKQEATAITLNKAELDKLFRDGAESTIVNLTGLGEEVEALIHDVEFDPVKGGVQHVDFYAVERGKELTTEVSLEFEGEAPAIKLGGSLTKVMHELEVTCRPSALPSHLTVDVSSLVDFDAQIKVKDITLPEGVKTEIDPEEVVALVSEVKEEEEAPVEQVDMDAIEVEEKGKGEESEEAEKTEE
ncbi:50S ribosomal protein L25 [Candidatus Kaiserbacteria bacterium]|nr:50S ribosomal protein L25 [Candidatus Kaiserbacteria bacterium]